jgi:hypothetical protein
MAEGLLIDTEFARQHNAMWRWMRSLSVRGDGVTFRNSETSAELLIQQKLAATAEDTNSGIGELAEVAVTQSGGSAGDATAACSFTYDWTDPDGTTHTTEAPTWHRQTGRLGAYLAGEHGLAERQDDGTWSLVVVDETADLDDTDGSKGWGPCHPCSENEHQAEFDPPPSGSDNKCQRLLSCRETIEVALDGWTEGGYAWADGVYTLTVGLYGGTAIGYWKHFSDDYQNTVQLRCNLDGDGSFTFFVFNPSDLTKSVSLRVPWSRICPPRGELLSMTGATILTETGMDWPDGATATITT